MEDCVPTTIRSFPDLEPADADSGKELAPPLRQSNRTAQSSHFTLCYVHFKPSHFIPILDGQCPDFLRQIIVEAKKYVMLG